MYRNRKWVIPLLLACLPIFWSASASGRPVVQPPPTAEETREGFEEQAAFIRSEIKAVSRDLEWLSLKIRDMEDFKRFVPRKMYDSVAFKKEKIASYKKLLDRYEKLGSAQPNKPAASGMPSGATEREKQLLGEINAIGLSGWLEVIHRGKDLTIENKLPVLFPSGSAEVPKGYVSFIKGIAELIKPHQAAVEITGFADTDPIKTSQYPSNFELGSARAAAVVRQFVRHGAKPSIFKVVSTGPHRHGKSTTAGKSLQRHADIVIRILK